MYNVKLTASVLSFRRPSGEQPEQEPAQKVLTRQPGPTARQMAIDRAPAIDEPSILALGNYAGFEASFRQRFHQLSARQLSLR